jgi:hydrogenase maturation protease
MGLSPEVQSAIEEASNLIEELIGRILAEIKHQPSPLQTPVLVTGNREVIS